MRLWYYIDILQKPIKFCCDIFLFYCQYFIWISFNSKFGYIDVNKFFNCMKTTFLATYYIIFNVIFLIKYFWNRIFVVVFYLIHELTVLGNFLQLQYCILLYFSVNTILSVINFMDSTTIPNIFSISINLHTTIDGSKRVIVY